MKDGFFSAKDLERPDLQRLIADIEAGQVDEVVVYKIDRLVRALMDFAKLVELFETHGVTFVSSGERIRQLSCPAAGRQSSRSLWRTGLPRA